MLNDPDTSLGAGTELAKLKDLFTGSIQGIDDAPIPTELTCNGESDEAGGTPTARLSMLKEYKGIPTDDLSHMKLFTLLPCGHIKPENCNFSEDKGS
jgi:hypothetical protein